MAVKELKQNVNIPVTWRRASAVFEYDSGVFAAKKTLILNRNRHSGTDFSSFFVSAVKMFTVDILRMKPAWHEHL